MCVRERERERERERGEREREREREKRRGKGLCVCVYVCGYRTGSLHMLHVGLVLSLVALLVLLSLQRHNEGYESVSKTKTKLIRNKSVFDLLVVKSTRFRRERVKFNTKLVLDGL